MQFTVIIATCNWPERLEQALAAVRRSIEQMGQSQAVIVSDNGPDRPAEAVARAFADRADFPVTYIKSDPFSKAAALNKAIWSSETPWVAFTDDDCLPDPGWLAAASKHIGGSDVNLFSGLLRHVPPDFPLPRWLNNDELPWSPAFVDYAPLPQSGIMDDNERVPFGANLFVKKSVYEQYGGYDEELWNRCGHAALGSEDAEFAIRVRERGEKIGYCAEAVVEHPVFAERVTRKYYLRHIFHSGMREPYFAESGTRAPYSYLARSMLTSLLKSAGSSITGKPARAMYHLMEATRDAGEIRGWQRYTPAS